MEKSKRMKVQAEFQEENKEKRIKRIIAREGLYLLIVIGIGVVVVFIGFGLPNQSKLAANYKGPYTIGDYFLEIGNLIPLWGYSILLLIRLIIRFIIKRLKFFTARPKFVIIKIHFILCIIQELTQSCYKNEFISVGE